MAIYIKEFGKTREGMKHKSLLAFYKFSVTEPYGNLYKRIWKNKSR